MQQANAQCIYSAVKKAFFVDANAINMPGFHFPLMSLVAKRGESVKMCVCVLSLREEI